METLVGGKRMSADALRRVSCDAILEGDGLTLLIGIEQVSPAVAKAWLIRNVRNRPFTRSLSERLAAAMERGEWRLNGETIIFDPEGNLLNGQHRLTAVVNSGVTITTLVVRGIPRSAFSTMDAGRPRQAADTLAIDEHTHTYALAASARLIVAAESGQFDIANRVSSEQVRQCVEGHPELQEWCAMSQKMPHRFIAESVICAFGYMFSRRHGKESVQEFYDEIRSGEGLTSGDPALTLRNRILLDRANNKLHGVRGRNASAHLLTSAWRVRVRGGRIAKLVLPDDLNRFPELP